MTSQGEQNVDHAEISFNKLKKGVEGKGLNIAKPTLEKLEGMVGSHLGLRKAQDIHRSTMLQEYFLAFTETEDRDISDFIKFRRHLAVKALMPANPAALEGVLGDFELESLEHAIESNEIDKLDLATALSKVNDGSIKENYKIIAAGQKNTFELRKLSALYSVPEARKAIKVSLKNGTLDEDFSDIYESFFKEIGDSEEDLELYEDLLGRNKAAEAMEEEKTEEKLETKEMIVEDDKTLRFAEEELRNFIPQGLELNVTKVSNEGTEFIILDPDDKNTVLPALFNAKNALITFKPEGFAAKTFPTDQAIDELIESYKHDYQIPELLKPLKLPKSLQKKCIELILGSKRKGALSLDEGDLARVERIFGVLSLNDEELQKSMLELGILISNDEEALNVQAINEDKLLAIIDYIQTNSINQYTKASFELIKAKFG